jgi:hypothetical protein
MVVTGVIELQEFEGFSLFAYQLGNDEGEIGWLFSVVRPGAPSENRYWVVKEDFYSTLHWIAFDGHIRTIETTTPPANETMDQAERAAMLRAIAEYEPLDLSSVRRRIPGTNDKL